MMTVEQAMNISSTEEIVDGLEQGLDQEFAIFLALREFGECNEWYRLFADYEWARPHPECEC